MIIMIIIKVDSDWKLIKKYLNCNRYLIRTKTSSTFFWIINNKDKVTIWISDYSNFEHFLSVFNWSPACDVTKCKRILEFERKKIEEAKAYKSGFLIHYGKTPSF